jgi:YD repeat-containing protein
MNNVTFRPTRLFILGLVLQLAASGANYTYDSAGHLIEVNYGAAGVVVYSYDSAGNLVARSVTVPPPLMTQTIAFGPLASQPFGTPPFTISATATSGLAVTFSSTPTGVCTVAGNVVSILLVGTCSITAAQSGNASYAAATPVDQSFQVTQATPTVTWSSPAAIAYGIALSATQLDATANVPGTFVYTPPAGTVLPAGNGQTLSVTFTPTDTTDYTTVTVTTTINVGKVTPTVTWTKPAAITYGTALSPTQLDATANVTGTFVYTPAAGVVLPAGEGQTLSVTFTPTNATDYKAATATTKINVNKATPTVAWAKPATITYGTALSATQLDATANVPGKFVYTPDAGTVLPGGYDQTLSVTFTPTDATDYKTATATKTINVDKATPTVTWAKPAAITYGTALSATQLDATSNVPGTFVYTPDAGTVLPIGNRKKLSAVFTPADTEDYKVVSASTTIDVLKASQ